MGTTVSGSSAFGVIVADPPWAYANWSDAAHGAARSSFACLAEAELARVPVARWAAADCVLALWATGPKLPEALRVMAAWGFDYVAWVPWVKTVESTGEPRRGVGFWSMGCAEMVLYGRRGAPRMRDRRDTPLGLLADHGGERVFYAPAARRHSTKPEGVQDLLERRFDGPYLELFARRERPGWTTWGLECPPGVRLGEAGAELAATGEVIA